ncbi:UDP-N-acetylglucosamine 1-carboxyvinyltransferase [Lachnospiraceae bacterium NSJ-143]|nr:UDP-N-acetylglucosamine 1-carboxyvinyltransferase [Lachnospiraceae bacterium NSJ-143]
MDRLVIRGKKRLSGNVLISGAKNAAVAVIPAAIMADDVCVIDNLPYIEDVKCLYTTINKMGAECVYSDKHTLKIDSSSNVSTTVTFDEVRKMRASYYLLGALLARFKRAEVTMPGGCNFGTRPIDLHLKGFRALGAEVDVQGEVVCVRADKLKGASIYMDTVSVGATINIMLAATMAEGVTTIENAAKEPHIVDVANFLNMMGAKIKGAGTDVIKIVGVDRLHGAEYTIIPDQIEAGTYMIAAAITGGRVKVCNIIPKHMDSLSAKLLEIGIGIEEGDDFITVDATESDFKATSIRTMAYPGFPTDLQPQIAALLSVCGGTSMITENVWEKRYQYIDELKRLGAKITVEGRVAIIEGVKELTGASVEATDLRAGAAMIIAALNARGETVIGEVKYIDRGYEEVESKFSALGADIRRVSV